MNQKDIRKQCEKLWARNKYYVLSKSHKVYLEIREYFKESEVELEVLLQKINEVNEIRESKKDFHNAILHVWGYFIKIHQKKSKKINCFVYWRSIELEQVIKVLSSIISIHY